MTNDVSVELLPCPFCGSAKAFLSRAPIGVVMPSVACMECGARGPAKPPGAQGEQQAIEAWNTRPSPTPSTGELVELNADGATPSQVERANAAVQANLNGDGLPKYNSAFGYACALSAIVAADASPTPSEDVVERAAAIRVVSQLAAEFDGGGRWGTEGARFAEKIIQALARLSPLPLVGED